MSLLSVSLRKNPSVPCERNPDEKVSGNFGDYHWRNENVYYREGNRENISFFLFFLFPWFHSGFYFLAFRWSSKKSLNAQKIFLLTSYLCIQVNKIIQNERVHYYIEILLGNFTEHRTTYCQLHLINKKGTREG